MTETEIIKYIKTHSMKEVFDNIPDDAYTSKIAETLNEDLLSCLYLIAKNSDFSDMTKETALLLLGEPKTEYRTDKSYDNYSILPPNLQSDPDIIRIVTSDIEHLPKDFYKNRECMKYLLNKYNEGNSRSAFSDRNVFIIIPDITEKPYKLIVYLRDDNLEHFQAKIRVREALSKIDITQPFEEVAPKLCWSLENVRGHVLGAGGKYITKIED